MVWYVIRAAIKSSNKRILALGWNYVFPRGGINSTMSSEGNKIDFVYAHLGNVKNLQFI